METYLVGGAVRDALLGLPVKDRDWVVVGATPEDMLSRGFRQVGADFPVFIHPDTGEEYALARTERKQGRGYHGFQVYSAPDVTLEEDLLRRDLTINAMARAEDGRIIDPFQGQADLQARKLRHVSEAFAEDPLRILRTARFAARFEPLGFTIAEPTWQRMRSMVDAGEVADLVPERVWQETFRALHEQAPTVYFEVLQACGALAVLVPELADSTRLEAALDALNCLSTSAHGQNSTTDMRFAALLSVLAPGEIKPRLKALKAPNDCQELARLTVELAASLIHAHSPEDRLNLLDRADAWRRPERFERLMGVCRCLTPGLDTEGAEALHRAWQEARNVEAKALIAQGYTGRELGEAIRRERLQRIKALTQP